MTYYIFRHGETFVTKRGKTGYGLGVFAYGFKIYSAPILEEGKPALYKMGEFLKGKPMDAGFSSPLLRCKQTADIITEVTGQEFIFDKRLREFFMESFGSLIGRLQSLLKEIDEKNYESVAICTHAGVIAALISMIIYDKKVPSQFDLLHYPMPGVLTIITDKNLQEINFNST